MVTSRGWHVRYGFGSEEGPPQDAMAYAIVLPEEISTEEQKEGRLMEADIPRSRCSPRTSCGTSVREPEEKKVRMGSAWGRRTGAPRRGVVPGSPAEKRESPRGLLVSFDGKPVKETSMSCTSSGEAGGGHGVGNVRRAARRNPRPDLLPHSEKTALTGRLYSGKGGCHVVPDADGRQRNRILLIGYLLRRWRPPTGDGALAAAFVLGLVNAVVRPLFVLLTSPHGGDPRDFLLVINGLLLWWFRPSSGIPRERFPRRRAGSVLVSIVSGS